MDREELKELLEEVLDAATEREHCKCQVGSAYEDEPGIAQDEQVDESNYSRYDWQESSYDFRLQNQYSKKGFFNYIMYRGKTIYESDEFDSTMEECAPHIFNSISSRLTKLYDFDYAIVEEEEACIAIAVPEFIKDAKTKISLALGIIPEAFVEVSGPTSTVVIIDCEKQFLRMKYLGVGESSWIL